MYENFIRERISSLRLSKNLSEYQLSLNLGHSKGYIQSISSGKVLPSMESFLDICDYFNISPAEFFDPTISNPTLHQKVVNEIKELSEDDLLLLLLVLTRFNSKT